MVNQRGQAALMDSIIFLTIIASVATMLFFFMANYGARADDQLDALYAEDFSIDVLKVITYINVTRDGRSVFEFSEEEDVEPEYDYLLAMMKEDYADTGTFTERTKRATASTISSALRPFDESIDYVYYLLNEDSDEYLFLMFAVHEPVLDRDGDIIEVKRVFYECQPHDKELLTQEVFPYVGEVNTAGGKIVLAEPYSTSNTPFIMSLNLWITKDLEILENLGDPDVEGGVVDLTCTAIPLD